MLLFTLEEHPNPKENSRREDNINSFFIIVLEVIVNKTMDFEQV